MCKAECEIDDMPKSFDMQAVRKPEITISNVIEAANITCVYFCNSLINIIEVQLPNNPFKLPPFPLGHPGGLLRDLFTLKHTAHAVNRL